MQKNDLEAKVYKLKNELYDETRQDKDGEWHDGAHYTLNRVLDILQEYSN